MESNNNTDFLWDTPSIIGEITLFHYQIFCISLGYLDEGKDLSLWQSTMCIMQCIHHAVCVWGLLRIIPPGWPNFLWPVSKGGWVCVQAGRFPKPKPALQGSSYCAPATKGLLGCCTRLELAWRKIPSRHHCTLLINFFCNLLFVNADVAYNYKR